MTAYYFTIDSDNIDAELTDFPVGIKLSAAFLLGLGADDWKYLHCTVDDVECYVEVEAWDPTNELGVIWVKVPTVSASEDTAIKIEKTAVDNHEIEITTATVWDDFTGSNGDDPNKYLWTTTAATGTNYLDIQSNKLYYDSPGGNANHATHVKSKFTLSGDFDIQVDFGIEAEDIPTDSYSYCGQLEVLQVSDDGKIGSIGAINEYSPGARWLARGTDLASDRPSRSQSSGKLRIIRESGVVTVFYWNGSQWEFDSDTDGKEVAASNNNDGYVRLVFEQENNSTIESWFDNFTINSCDSINGYVGETGDMQAQNVWDDDFVAVYHMAQDPSGGSDCILDSTFNENHGTPAGSMTSGDLVDGDFGKAIDFDGSDDYVNLGDLSEVEGESALTVEAFLYVDNFVDNRAIVRKWASGNQCFNFGTTDYPSFNTYQIELNDDSAAPSIRAYPASTHLLTDGYKYLSTSWNGGNTAKLYHSQTLKTSTYISQTTIATLDAVSEPACIGGRYNGGSPDLFIDAKISEVRISKTQRSAAYIKATYHVLYDTIGELAVGEESSPTAYFYIEADDIDTSLNYYPVGIKIDSGDALDFFDTLNDLDWQYLHATVDGEECFVEVDQWDPDNNLAILWVNVPTVSASAMTVIKLEIDKTTIRSQTVIDDFTGTNGDEPDSDLWIKDDDLAANVDCVSIQSNKLNFDSTGESTAVYHRTWLKSLLEFPSDFDIQIDFDHTTINANNGNSKSNIPCMRMEEQDGSRVAQVQCALIGSQKSYIATDNSSDLDTVNHSDTSGKLRIKRTNGVIVGYYWSGSQWEWDGDTDGYTIESNNTNTLHVVLNLRAYTGGSCNFNVDNFTINLANGYYDIAQNNYKRRIESPYTVATFSGANGASLPIRFDCKDGVDIQNNTAFGTVTTGNKWIKPHLRFDGDFDIQVDVDITTRSNTNRWSISLRMYNDSGWSYRNTREYRDSTNRFKGWKYEGSWSHVGTHSSNTDSFKLRLKRFGDDITYYFDDGGGWEELGADTNATTNEMYPYFYIDTADGEPEIAAGFSNFIINQADSVTMFVGETGDVAAGIAWKPNHVAVYHLHQAPPSTIKDSSINAFDGTATNMTSANYVNDPAGWHKAIDFEGNGDVVKCPDDTAMNDLSNFTVEAIFNPDDYGDDGGYGRVYKKAGTQNANGHQLYLDTSNSGWTFQSAWNSGSNIATWEAQNAITLDDDHYIAVTYDNTDTANDPVFYQGMIGDDDFDSYEVTEGATQPSGSVDSDSGYDLWIGARNAGGGVTDYEFDGTISEFRYSDVERGEAWLKANFLCFSDALVTYSATDPAAVVEPYHDIAYSMDDITDRLSMGLPGPGYSMDSITSNPKRTLE